MAEKLTELPAVAKNILLECKKCEGEKFHRVLAHKTKTSASVQCEICGSKKTFKLPAASKGKKKTGGRKRKPVVTQQEIWKKQKDEYSGPDPQVYNMRSSFEPNIAIDHPKFGLGFVVEVYPDKIQVSFEEEAKALVHNRQS